MGLFDQFPYTNFHELNLDWVLQALKGLEQTLDQFVAANALSYADPIQWDITSQYKKNTIVIDPQSGTAYISVQPVPEGIALTNTDYWTVVFDLERLIPSANNNITLRVESQTTTTATFPTNINEWLVWDGILYRALTNITAGDQYVVDSNIKRITVEEYIVDILNAISNIVSSVGDLSALTTTDKSNLVAAINEIVSNLAAEVTARSNADGDLSDLNTTDKSNLVAAIHEVNSTGGGALAKIGDLADLTTTDKSNVVAAINEVNSDLNTLISHDKIINVLDYGAVGDGIADDTAAIKEAVDELNITGGVLYFPQGRYKISDTLDITHVGSCVRGDTQQGSYILQSADKTALHFGNGSTPTISFRVEDIGIVCTYPTPAINVYGIHFDYAVNSTINNVVIGEFYVGIYWSHVGNSFVTDTGVVASHANAIGINVGDQSVSTNFSNIYVGFSGQAADTGIGFIANRGNVADCSIDYIDIGNGYYGIFYDATNTPAEYPPADIRFSNVVVDGSRGACISLNNINSRGNVVISGGWLNPLNAANSKCVSINNCNNISLRDITMQCLADVSSYLLAVAITGCTGVNITGCNFLNVMQAISTSNVDRLMVNNNFVSMPAALSSIADAMYFADTYNLMVANNEIFGAYASMINVASGNVSIVKDNVYQSGSTITDNHAIKIVSDNLALS